MSTSVDYYIVLRIITHYFFIFSFKYDKYAWIMMCFKNIVKHTVHTIVSWPNPKQWLMIHTSGLMMIIR